VIADHRLCCCVASLCVDVQRAVQLTRFMLNLGEGAGSVAVRDIVGLSFDAVKKSLRLHVYPLRDGGACCGGGERARVYEPVELRHSDAGVLAVWELTLTQLLRGYPLVRNEAGRPPRRRMLVLINPFGGKGEAADTLAGVEPLLKHIGADITRIGTKHRPLLPPTQRTRLTE
jgi:hypothetical protein